MVKKLALLMGVILLLAIPVSAGRFPSLPSITKEEAKNLGLIATFNNSGGGYPDSNYVLFYQDFMCANHAPDAFNYIRVSAAYYTDNEAVELFNSFVEVWRNATDRVEDFTDFWTGEVVGSQSTHYEFHEGPNYAEIREVYERRYFDGGGFVSIKHTYVALVDDHYYVYSEVEYSKGKTACDLEGLAPVLLNMYLSRIPNNTVRFPVGSSQGGNSSASTTSPAPKTTSTTPKVGDVRLTIIAPRDGATLKQVFDGYFTMSLLAEVKGSDAKNLYAVVTLPDGSKKREAVMGDTIADIIEISDPSVKGGTVRVDIYGTFNGTKKLLASDSVKISFVSKEVPGDNIDNDLDGLVDCDDPDVATCDACIQQKKLEWAESLMNRHIAYIKKMIEVSPAMKSVYETYIDDLHEIHDKYKDDPDRMVKEMNDYMEAKVYSNQKIQSYLSIFKDDPEKRYQLRQIAEKYRYDPIMRDIKMRDFIYKNAQSVAERTAITNAIITGVIEPPQWLVGGQYGSGGAIDWAHFIASNFEKVGDTVKFKGNTKVKILRTPATIYLVALDAKALMDEARELQNMNLPENTKVSIIVLDGATKIGKLLDPTGYFGNMADATLGAIVNLRKKIEERNQGWFTWHGYVLHETAIPGIYEDYETGKKFKRVGGGWMSSPSFVEVTNNG